MPIFMDSLQAEEVRIRAGVCIGLKELVKAAPKQSLHEYLNISRSIHRLRGPLKGGRTVYTVQCRTYKSTTTYSIAKYSVTVNYSFVFRLRLKWAWATRYLSDMLPAVREAICDEDESVRKHASGVLSLLYDSVGQVTESARARSYFLS